MNIRAGTTVAVLAVSLAGCAAGTSTGKAASTTAATAAAATAATVAPLTTAPVTAPPTSAGPVETAGQTNVRESAAQYLSNQAFSRTGLINQLSSSAGDGYSLADSTYGVDAQHADWNHQAVLSAKQYLSTGPFSRTDLINQLSSAAGEGFTYAQAVFGVTGAGL